MPNESYHTTDDLRKAIAVLRRDLVSMNPQIRVQAAGFFVLASMLQPPVTPERAKMQGYEESKP